MTLVKSKNSRAELLVFAYLRKNRVYFQKHYAKAPGNPDIALPRKKRAVFIDGDYWHGRHLEKVTKNKFWKDKISKNLVRDRVVMKKLELNNWSVLRVWESDIIRKRTRQDALQRIKEFLIV